MTKYPTYNYTLPIDPEFDIRHYTDEIFDINTNAYFNFAILIGILNKAPVSMVTSYYLDTSIFLSWLETTPVNRFNIFKREQVKPFEKEKSLLHWFAFLKKDLMIYATNTYIQFIYASEAEKDAKDLAAFFENLFKEKKPYREKICIYDYEESQKTYIKLNRMDNQDALKPEGDQLTNYQKIIDTFNKKENVSGVVVIAGNDQKRISNYIKHLIFTIDKRFVYISQRDVPNLEYKFMGKEFEKGINVFIVENAEYYFPIKKYLKNSLADYVNKILRGKLKKPFPEPLLISINGNISDFPALIDSKNKHITALIQL